MKINLIILIGMLSLLLSCGSRHTDSLPRGKQKNLSYAENLIITEIEPDVTVVSVKNPWDTAKIMANYALIDRNRSVPSYISEDFTVIKIPVENSIVYSGVHISLIDELGAFEKVKGICDTEYIHHERSLDALKKGKIVDCGTSTSLNIERILTLHPEIVLSSPYEGNDGTSPYLKTGIKIIQAGDYMEKTPLGRAEWMKFYGLLFGKGDKADSLFNSIEKEYNDLKRKASNSNFKPIVMFDRIYSGVWDVPTSGSVTGILINDAGGTNPFDNYNQGGSAHLSAEEVLLKAMNSDVWLIRYIEPDFSIESLGKDNAIYKKFKPYLKNKIYGSNTLKTNLFEDGAFHPNLTLREMIRLLHPEIDSGSLQYYKKLK